MSEMQNCKCGANATEEELYQVLDDLLVEYKDVQGALIPILQTTQRIFGFLPKDALKKISVTLGISYSEVSGVVSFYSFFSTFPRGKYLIRVCLGTACYVRGGKEVLSSLKKELAIDVGQTTEDRLFSIDIGRCFGACGLAPVIMVNDNVHQRVKPDKISEIIHYYKYQEKELSKQESK